ncbi:MAG: NUDIX hydrolase [Candidatus Aenigmarchaeota archaeon]|nr:NUDIX hydrolase [Candidatus Aenigmarchaeota archaeon]
MELTASGIILKDKKILLIKRGKDAPEYPDYWTIPGGIGESGESPEEIAIREIKEEVGLDFVPESIFKITYADWKKKYRFLGKWSGEIKLQKAESSRWGWFSYEETKNLKFAFDYRNVVEKLHEEGLF